MELPRLIIQPRYHLVGDIGRFDPTELIRKNDLPEEADDDQKQAEWGCDSIRDRSKPAALGNSDAFRQ